MAGIREVVGKEFARALRTLVAFVDHAMDEALVTICIWEDLLLQKPGRCAVLRHLQRVGNSPATPPRLRGRRWSRPTLSPGHSWERRWRGGSTGAAAWAEGGQSYSAALPILWRWAIKHRLCRLLSQLSVLNDIAAKFVGATRVAVLGG